MFRFLKNPHKLSTEEWQKLLGNVFVTSIIYHMYRMISSLFVLFAKEVLFISSAQKYLKIETSGSL